MPAQSSSGIIPHNAVMGRPGIASTTIAGGGGSTGGDNYLPGPSVQPKLPGQDRDLRGDAYALVLEADRRLRQSSQLTTNSRARVKQVRDLLRQQLKDNADPSVIHESLDELKVALDSLQQDMASQAAVFGAPPRRGMPAPLDPVFPSTEYIGVAGTMMIGVPDTDPVWPLEKAIWKACPMLKKARIKIYGWTNPGYGYSTSHHSNIPLSYYVTPNRLELDQQILRIERVPDTVQTEHMDWGFRFTNLYGIDYRYTTAQGWYPASDLLLYQNRLYGYDPVECYGMVYVPKVAQGMVLKFGRYISPPDIEAQLAPDNFLWTHSQMFTVDTYTQTGLIASIMLNKQWMLQTAIHAGSDMAPWEKTAIPTGLLLLRWVSKNNNDSIYGGCDSINNGAFRLGKELVNATNAANLLGVTPPRIPAHQNLQQFNLTWSHRFNRQGTIVTMTEGYFLYEYNSIVGGTPNYGPPKNFNALVGPGTAISGLAPSWGLVNYTAFKVSPKDYICIRPVDFLGDCKGERTGFKTTYSTWTIGWCHRFSNLLCIRPEIRYERALNYTGGNIVTPYDNGTKRYQFTFGFDLIQRF